MVNTLSLGAAGSPRSVAVGNSKSKLTLRLCGESGHCHDENLTAKADPKSHLA